MKQTHKFFVFAAIICVALLLTRCKHDPPAAKATNGLPDSLYVGHPYTFPDNTVAHTTAAYRQVIVPADNPETYEGIAVGRMLFYDSTLSLNHKVACGTCHKQQYGFGDNQKLSQNVHGSTVRNASTLANLGLNAMFFWDGRQSSIEDAANDALTHEQDPDFSSTLRYLDTTHAYNYLFRKAFGRAGDSVTQPMIVKALAQFIRTLISENSRYDMYSKGLLAAAFTTSETNGLSIFLNPQQGDCAHCHVDPGYLTLALQNPAMKNNALDTVADVHMFADPGYGAISGNLYDYGKFKIPTLRNVAVSAPYMHDGRFTTLDQIADHYGTRDSLKRSPTIDPLMERFAYSNIPDLTAQQKSDLVAFLRTLTDTAFLNNPNFSNPFHH